MNVAMPLPGFNSRGYSYAQKQDDGQLHPGADLNVGAGDDDLGLPVVAFADGTIVGRIDWNRSSFGYGNALLLQHDFPGLQLWTIYAHLDAFHSNSVLGYPAACGEEIGWCGKSGYQLWSHLHFEIRYQGPPAMPIEYWGGGLPIQTLSDRYADPYTLFKVLGTMPAPAVDCSAVEAQLALVTDDRDRCNTLKAQFENWISTTPLWTRPNPARAKYKRVDNAATVQALIAAANQ